MVVCKDGCLYETLCKYNDGINEWCKSNCPLFKNKADFVKIPCMCKDCQHFKFINIGGLVGVCNLDDDSQRSVGLEDYCSYGERQGNK